MPFEPNTLVRAEDIIKAEEGLRLKAYKDTRGIWTIGYGYNLEANGYSKADAAKVVWTHSRAEAEFDRSIAKVIEALDKYIPDWRGLAPARQAVAISATYQLGIKGVMEFAPTISHIRAGEYEDAAKHMEASKWGKKQTPARVKRLAAMMRTGEWPASGPGSSTT